MERGETVNSNLLIVGLCNILVSVVCIASAIPLVRHKVKMNYWYGIRIPKSYSSPENWEKINEYGGRALIYWSIPILLIGSAVVAAAFMLPKSEMQNTDWMVLFTPLSALLLLGALVQTLIWSKKLPD